MRIHIIALFGIAVLAIGTLATTNVDAAVTVETDKTTFLSNTGAVQHLPLIPDLG